MRKVIGDRAVVTGYSGRSQVAETHPDIYPVTEGLQAWCETVFEQSEVLIFIGLLYRSFAISKTNAKPLKFELF